MGVFAEELYLVLADEVVWLFDVVQELLDARGYCLEVRLSFGTVDILKSYEFLWVAEHVWYGAS